MSTDIKSILNSEAMQFQIARALPEHMTASRMIRVATTALVRTPKLLQCTQESFFSALLTLSAIGLEPDGRNAHLIPYGKDCTLVVDYKGLVTLVRRSGEVSDIHCDVVRENDLFNEVNGQVTHSIDRRKPRGEVFAVYSRVTLKDGSVSCEVMSKEDVEKIRAKSPAGKSGPWIDHWDEMAKKTVFKRHSKWLPISADVQDTIAREDEADYGVRDVTPRKPLERAKRIEPSKQSTPKEAPKEAPPKAKKQVTKAEDHPASNSVKPVKAWIESHSTQEGESKGKPWKLHSVGLIVDGKHVDAKTFSETLGSLAEFNVDRPCVVALEETPKGVKLASLEIVDEEEGGLL